MSDFDPNLGNIIVICQFDNLQLCAQTLHVKLKQPNLKK